MEKSGDGYVGNQWENIERSGSGFFQSKWKNLAMAMWGNQWKTLEEVAVVYFVPKNMISDRFTQIESINRIEFFYTALLITSISLIK